MAKHPANRTAMSLEQTQPAVVEPMLDHARPRPNPLPAETRSLVEIASDRARELSERLDAYEDIIDSEVGDTDLFRARNVERDVGLRQIFMKFEGANPSGTQKDRIAFAQAQDALRRGFDTITVATCGNYGAAVSQAAAMAGIGCVIFIPAGYKTRREGEMIARAASIERVPGDYEHAVDVSRERAVEHEYYDANPGGTNLDLQLRAYGSIAHEIYDELRDAPAAVAVPVSNGTTLAGVYRGFQSLYRRGKTSRIPPHRRGLLLRRQRDRARLAARQRGLRGPASREGPRDGCQRTVDQLALRSTAIMRSTPSGHPGGWAAHASDKALLAHGALDPRAAGLEPAARIHRGALRAPRLAPQGPAARRSLRRTPDRSQMK